MLIWLSARLSFIWEDDKFFILFIYSSKRIFLIRSYSEAYDPFSGFKSIFWYFFIEGISIPLGPHSSSKATSSLPYPLRLIIYFFFSDRSLLRLLILSKCSVSFRKKFSFSSRTIAYALVFLAYFSIFYRYYYVWSCSLFLMTMISSSRRWFSSM
jgi:hypothetical protein